MMMVWIVVVKGVGGCGGNGPCVWELLGSRIEFLKVVVTKEDGV